MTITLRPYQATNYGEIQQAWQQGADNVLYRADTGAGKTAVMAYDVATNSGASCLMAHRNELVAQISAMLGRYGVYHDLIASQDTRRAIAKMHMDDFGTCFYRPDSACKVASVQTLTRRDIPTSWASQVTKVIPDESHHCLRDNQHGAAIEIFTNPKRKMLMPTATPKRADGKGLGSHADGFADLMIQAPPMRWLINSGYLTDYRIVCPPSDLQVLEDVGTNGDWSSTQLREAAKRSHIVGDVVWHYLRWAMNLKTLVFCTDVETAIETTAAFVEAGIRAVTLTGKTHGDLRRKYIKQLERGEIQVIVAVDIISEGFDLPAVECVIMARPTASLALYMQQFGRSLRLLVGKLLALIIDPVGNVVRHMGPPDRPREWSLDRATKRAKAGPAEIAIRVCIECFQPYERFYRACPHCGYLPIPAGRGSPAAVDGDCEMMSADLLARLRGEEVDTDLTEGHIRTDLVLRHQPAAGVNRTVAARMVTQAAQRSLRQSMAAYGGIWHNAGYSDAEIQRRFFLEYAVDVLTARTLGAADAAALQVRIDLAVNRG